MKNYFTLLIILCPFMLLAQSVTYNTKYYNIENGLKNNRVNNIYTDDEGFVWICTIEGLQRFDGSQFVNYEKIANDSTSIHDNDVNLIMDAGDKKMWVGAKSNGFSLYDKRTDRFRWLPMKKEDKARAYRNKSFVDSKGVAWLYYFGGNRKGLKHIKVDSAFNITYAQDKTWDKPYFVKNQNAAYFLRPYNIKKIAYPSSSKKQISISNLFNSGYKPINASALSDEGIWFLVGHKLCFFDFKTEKGMFVQEYFKRKGINHYVNFNWLKKLDTSEYEHQKMYCDYEGNLWVAVHNVLYKIDLKTGEYSKHSYITNDRQNRGKIVWMSGKRDGIMWVYFLNRGICKVNLKVKKFRHLKHDEDNDNSLSFNVVRGMDTNGNYIWIGTDRTGLDRYNIKTQQFHNFPLEEDKKKQTPVKSVLIDSNNRLWACGGQNKTVFYSDNHTANPKDVVFNKVVLNVDGNTLSVNNIYEDPYHRIWLTSTYGLFYFNPKENKFIQHPLLTKVELGQMVFEAPNTLWIGSWGEGLLKITFNSHKKLLTKGDLKNIKIANFQLDKSDKLSLPDNRIISLNLDSEKTLWLGTWGSGLVKKVEKEGKTSFITYDKSNGLSNNTVLGLLSANDGKIWASTNKGLNVFDPKTETSKIYTKSDGIQSDAFFENAFHKSETGELLFGGINGVNIFNPEEIVDDTEELHTYISDLNILNQPMRAGDTINNRVILKESIQYQKEIILTHKEEFFSIYFGALDYVNNEELKYAYKLEGLNNEWIEVNAHERKASFNKLPAGEYVFKVKAANSDGFWNDTPTELKIVILPPWWETWWFKTLIILFIGSFVVLFYKVRMRNLKKQKVLLTRKVEERTAELKQERDNLSQAYDTIAEKNTLITDSINYAQKIQHAILPSEKLLHESFEDHFVIYKPKDVVSGDFYWMSQRDNKTFIAVVDCTGHGVPGAFLSMIGSSLLNRIVNEMKVDDTDEILTILNELIRDALRQHEAKNDDGMDMSFCCIERLNDDKITLHFTGAKNDLFYSQNGDLQRIKGDRKSIGGIRENTKVFTSNTIQANKGDRVYMITDGIIDQNNEERSRFGSTKLLEVLNEGVNMSVTAHKAYIENELHCFQQNASQRDDITLLGFEL